jgi:hypothetical protein
MNFNSIWLGDAFLRSRRVKASLLFFTAKRTRRIAKVFYHKDLRGRDF